MQINLAGGQQADLTELSREELRTLQFAQEREFAHRIRRAPKGSPERAAAISQGYDTVCSILTRIQHSDTPLMMGFDKRYTRLVVELLRAHARRFTVSPRLFEIGFGSGQLLAAAHAAGFDVAGLEVSGTMHEQACAVLPEECHAALLHGELLHHPKLEKPSQFDVIYWNDVFEHIAPDEIGDYLARIHRLLRPGGCLITITPNWHERPSDITSYFQPPRTEACGLHLKEYTLREVTSLLCQTGFARVEVPLLKTPGRYILGLGGLSGLKRRFEPCLEWLPFWLAEKLVRGMAISCTMAYKSQSAEPGVS